MKAPLPYKALIWALAVLLSACLRPEGKGGEVEILFSLDAAPKLKSLEGAVDENSVVYWCLLIYDNNGRLLKEVMDLKTSSYSMVVDAGEYSRVTVYAFANIEPGSLEMGWADEDKLLSNSYGLDIVQQNGILPMGFRLRTGFSSSGTVGISLKRMVSKIRLRSLVVDLKGKYAEDEFYEGAVYLQNVIPKMSLKQYFSNTSDIAATEGHYPWFYHDNWLYSIFTTDKYRGEYDERDAAGLFGIGELFYTLPNFCHALPSDDPDWADLCTKLVVEAEYKSKESQELLEVYYPVEVLNLQSGFLEPNNVYDVDIVIHAPGYSDPWGPRVNVDPQVSFSLEVQTWDNYSINENI